VLEAIILEAYLIKKHQPKYNTKEKSDKSFNYVVITKEKLPKVTIVRERNLGSYSGKGFSQVLGSLGPSPSQTIRKPFSASAIFGPFTSGLQLREAMKIIRPIFPYLDEKYKNNYRFYKQVDLVPDVASAEGLKQYKNNIRNLKLFFEGKKKQVLRNLEKEMKLFAKIHAFEKAGGVKRKIFALKHINDVALIKENGFVSSNFSSLRPSPEYRGGALGKLKIERSSAETDSFRIEAYDIAHMSGKNMVGVMTVVEDGEVAKSEYKNFKIRTQSGANDTGALSEVLERRLAHTEWTHPNLIVVDGGVAQINVAKKVLQKINKNIEIVSVLKDERHRPKDILGDKKIASKYEKEILLANSEAHRFAISYHKNMRNKNFLK
jgi:excinuclease ABC subunit C